MRDACVVAGTSKLTPGNALPPVIIRPLWRE
jgi:hypothetical protein